MKLRTTIISLLATFFLSLSTASIAAEKNFTPINNNTQKANKNNNRAMAWQKRAEENRKKSMAEYAKWQKLSQTQKLEYIEKERLQKMKEGEEKWNKMSPVKKIEMKEKAFLRQVEDPKVKKAQSENNLRNRCAQIMGRNPNTFKAAANNNTKTAQKKPVYNLGKP